MSTKVARIRAHKNGWVQQHREDLALQAGERRIPMDSSGELREIGVWLGSLLLQVMLKVKEIQLQVLSSLAWETWITLVTAIN